MLLFSCKTAGVGVSYFEGVEISVLVEEGYKIEMLDGREPVLVPDLDLAGAKTYRLFLRNVSYAAAEGIKSRLLATGAVHVDLAVLK